MKNKIICALMVVIIITGIIVTWKKGLNLGVEYSSGVSVDIDLGQEFDNKEIKNIVKEVMGDNTKVIIKKIEVFKEMVSIELKEISDEQYEQLKNKIQEKYAIELNDNTIVKTEKIQSNIVEMFKPYVKAAIIITVIVFVYEVVRYHKKGILLVMAKSFGILVMPTAVVYSLIAITRMPVTKFTIPILILVYIISITSSCILIEKMPNKEEKAKVKK